jgi:hypothetical protein
MARREDGVRGESRDGEGCGRPWQTGAGVHDGYKGEGWDQEWQGRGVRSHECVQWGACAEFTADAEGLGERVPRQEREADGEERWECNIEADEREGDDERGSSCVGVGAI